MDVRTTRALAAVIRGQRLRLGLTQDQLATRSGLSRRSIVDLESAQSEPRFGALLALCDALELSLSIHSNDAPVPDPANRPSRVDLDELLDGHSN